jgi:Fe-S-cluster-containing dehydrogenase component
MIMVDFIDREASVATQPTLCMHCEDPVAPCAQVCPVNAILITEDGVVQQADPSRCIGCRNCVYACPFGVPKFDVSARLMKKCNLCYDRTAQGLQPWCAQACPTDAIWYGTFEEFDAQRQGHAVADTQFGEQNVHTRVFNVLPPETDQLEMLPMISGGSIKAAVAAEEEAWVL